MSEAGPTPVGGNPFTARTALALVVFGSLAFVALLWMIGNGLAQGSANNGGAHGEGRGLNGYAAVADLLERQGHAVRTSRSRAGFDQPGLLVLTPQPTANGKDITEAVERHRRVGPVLVIAPKWTAFPLPSGDLRAKKGWVQLAGPGEINWPGFLDQLTLNASEGAKGAQVRWRSRMAAGTFPDARRTLAGVGPGLLPLVEGADGRVFAAYMDDGVFPAMARQALRPADAATRYRSQTYPLIVVFDADLLSNYGMAQRPSAELAVQLVNAAAGRETPITFDLTLAGLEFKPNLLSLAFTPPFLAATLCLLLAAMAIGWRAFLRFGPPLVPGRAIAFGKRALVTNAAGLIVRSRRLHLLGPPYADAVRARLIRALGLSRAGDEAADTLAIDRAAVARGEPKHAFSQAAARLRQARSERELVKAAADLHALERTLTR